MHKVFTSIEQAGNWLKGIKKLVEKKASMENFPVTTAMPQERRRYLLYGISLLNEKDYPTDQRGKISMVKNLLRARASGYSLEWLANHSGCSLETSKKWEKEGICLVKDAINNRIKHNLPILGRN